MWRFRLLGFIGVVATVTACAVSIQTPTRTSAPPSPTVPPTRTPRPAATPEPALTLESVLGEGSVGAIAWSTDGAKLAIGGTGGVTIYDAATLALEQTLEVKDLNGWDVSRLAFSPNGEFLLVGWFDQLRVYVLKNGTVRTLEPDVYLDSIADVAFSPDSQWIAVNIHYFSRDSSSTTVVLLDALSGRLKYEFISEESVEASAMAFSPDGRWFAVASQDQIRIWDVTDGSLATTLIGHTHTVLSLAFSPDGSALVSGGADGALRIWGVGAWSLTRTERDFSQAIDRLQFAADGGRLLVAVDHALQTRRWPSLEPVGVLDSVAPTVSISPDGRRFVDWLTVRDTLTGQVLGALPDYMAFTQQLAFSPDGSLLAVGNYGEFWLWDVDGRHPVVRESFPSRSVRPVFDSTGTTLLTLLNDDPEIIQWDLAGARPSRRWPIGPDAFQAPTISPTGHWLALARSGTDRRLQLWDLTDQSLAREFPWPSTTMPQSLAFDATERTLFATSSAGDEYAYDLASGSRQLIRSWDLHATDTSYRDLLSQDAERLAVVAEHFPDPSQVQIWDTRTGDLLLSRISHDYAASVPLMAFTYRGDWLVTGTSEGFRFFSASDPALSLAASTGDHQLVNGVISPDDSRLAIYTSDSRIMIWALSALRILAERTGAPSTRASATPIPPIPTATAELALALTPLPVPALQGSAITASSVVSLTETAVLGAGTIRAASLSADGRQIAIGGSLGVHVYRAVDLHPIAFFRTDRSVTRVCFSADGQRVVAGFGSNTLAAAWVIQTASPTDVLPECLDERAAVAGLHAEPDAHSGLVVRAEGSDVIQTAFGPYEQGVASYAVSPDGRALALGAEGQVHLIDLSSGQLRWSFEIAPFDSDMMQYDVQASRLTFSSDGQTLAAASDEGDLWVVSTATGVIKSQWHAHAGSLAALLFDPSGRRLYSAGFDGLLRVWNARTGQRLLEQNAFSAEKIWDISPIGASQVLTTDGGAVKRWDLTTGTVLQVMAVPSGTITSFLPHGSGLVLKTEPTAFDMWSLQPFQRRLSFVGELQGMYLMGNDLTDYSHFAVSPDGSLIATGGLDPSVRLWDATTGFERLTLEMDSNFIDGLAFSPDGRWLAVVRSGWTNPALLLLDAATGLQVREFALEPGSDPRPLAFSPDGMSVAVTNEVVQVWDLASAQAATVLEKPASALAYSPDGGLLAAGEVSGRVDLVDPRSGKFLYSLLAHSAPISQILFVDEGRALLTAAQDGTVRVWRIAR